jgi:hypothetical protein
LKSTAGNIAVKTALLTSSTPAVGMWRRYEQIGQRISFNNIFLTASKSALLSEEVSQINLQFPKKPLSRLKQNDQTAALPPVSGRVRLSAHYKMGFSPSRLVVT